MEEDRIVFVVQWSCVGKIKRKRYIRQHWCGVSGVIKLFSSLQAVQDDVLQSRVKSGQQWLREIRSATARVEDAISCGHVGSLKCHIRWTIKIESDRVRNVNCTVAVRLKVDRGQLRAIFIPNRESVKRAVVVFIFRPVKESNAQVERLFAIENARKLQLVEFQRYFVLRLRYP